MTTRAKNWILRPYLDSAHWIEEESTILVTDTFCVLTSVICANIATTHQVHASVSFLMLLIADVNKTWHRIGFWKDWFVPCLWKLINRFRNWKDGYKERNIDTLPLQKSWLYHKWSFFAEERKESNIKIRAVAIQGTLGTVQFRKFVFLSHTQSLELYLLCCWVRSAASCR